jgi:UrcA family protein
MLSVKSVASALVLVASAADVAVPVLVAPAIVLAVSTAARAEAPAVRQEVVRYGDLDLATPGGMAAFRTRLKGAVQTVCGPRADLRTFDETADYQACTAKASHDAMSALPRLRRQAARPSHEG